MRIRIGWAILVALGLSGTGGSLLTAEAGSKPLASYQVVVVEKFTVEPTDATVGFPRGNEAQVQGEVVDRLREKRLFEQVIDATETEAVEATAKTEAAPSAPAEASASSAPVRQEVRLSGTVILYTKGSRAKRYLVGFGAGAAKLKVRFIFRDAATGQEVFRTERQGKFYGTISFVGGGKGEATSEAAGDVVDGLIKDIKKNR